MFILINKKDYAFNGQEFVADYAKAVVYQTKDQVADVVKTLPKELGSLYAMFLNSSRRVKVR